MDLLKLLFGDAPTSFEGRFYSVHDLEGRPKPLQKPHPPLLLGGTRQRLLRFAGRVADIVSFDSGPISTPMSWRAEALQHQADTVHAAAGERRPELPLNPDVCGVGRPRRAVIDEAATRLGVDRDDLDQSAYVLAGTTEVIDALERLRATVGVSYITILSDHIDESRPWLINSRVSKQAVSRLIQGQRRGRTVAWRTTKDDCIARQRAPTWFPST